MSLEAAIAKLTEAVEANTAALAGGAAPSKPASKPAGGAKKAPPKKTTKKETTADDVVAAFGEYLKTGSKETRDEAKANVKKIVDHFGVERITLLDPENFDEALAFLKQYQDGEDPLEDEEEEDGDLM